ncbi:hypothetical protein BDV93DRAFT_563580 [Ceratobasidium sp. AG-I]|nr:hypothetical protein BDV93DRAFT_563580 [Ceratobasidium sp. AG-I]
MSTSYRLSLFQVGVLTPPLHTALDWLPGKACEAITHPQGVESAAAAAQLVSTPEPEHLEENLAPSAPSPAWASRLPSRYTGRS